MGSIKNNGGKNQARAGPGRGQYRYDKVEQIRFQQTKCKERRSDGKLWPPCDYWFQFDEIGKRSWRIIKRSNADKSQPMNIDKESQQPTPKDPSQGPSPSSMVQDECAKQA